LNVRAAAKVVQRLDNVEFVMAGWGDRGNICIVTYSYCSSL
jgi:hypothetical protein